MGEGRGSSKCNLLLGDKVIVNNVAYSTSSKKFKWEGYFCAGDLRMFILPLRLLTLSKSLFSPALIAVLDEVGVPSNS